jgi:hypothetical protein
VTKSAAGPVRAWHGPRPGLPWPEYLHSPDPGLRMLAAGQVTKAAGPRAAAVVPWGELMYGDDPALRVLAAEMVGKRMSA